MSVSSTQIEVFIKNNANKFDPSDLNSDINNQYYEMINKLISLSNLNQELYQLMIEGFVTYKFSMDDFINYVSVSEDDNVYLDINEISVSQFLLNVNSNTVASKESLKEQIKYYLGYADGSLISLTTDEETSIDAKSFDSELESFYNNKFDDTRRGGEYTDLFKAVLKNNNYKLLTPDIISLSLINFSTSNSSYTSFESAKTDYINIVNNITDINKSISKLKYKIIEFKNEYGIIPTLPNYPIRRILDRIKTSTLFLDHSSSDKYTNYNFLKTLKADYKNI